MSNNGPYYAILNVEPRYYSDIPAIEAHNSRTMRVPHAHTPHEGGCVQLRLSGKHLLHAINQRRNETSAPAPNPRRHAAFEAVVSYSPDTPTPPPLDVFCQRSLELADEIFGEGNIRAAWLHLDEKTPHIHLIGVPVVLGKRPGRPRDKSPALTVSWAQFSGSDRRVYKRGEPPPPNLVMARWQTEWADGWSDFGLRRGIPSSREHLSMRWIHDQHAGIARASEVAKADLYEAIHSFSLPTHELVRIAKSGCPEALAEVVGSCLEPGLNKALALLTNLAAKGIQLDAERKSRADIADQNARLRHDLEVSQNEAKGLRSAIQELGCEKGNLLKENTRLQQILASIDPQDIALLQPQTLRGLPLCSPTANIVAVKPEPER